jgi:hypothetical protein
MRLAPYAAQNTCTRMRVGLRPMSSGRLKYRGTNAAAHAGSSYVTMCESLRKVETRKAENTSML